MHRKLLILLLFFFCGCIAYSQSVLKGRVIASDTRKPIGLANVYLSNTAIGTVSADNGEFSINPFPSGRFELIVSFIGYETYTAVLQSSSLPSFLEITIKPKVNELKEVILMPYEKDGWARWGGLFLENFIGTSANSEDCKLLNKEAVKFRHNKKLNILYAFADETLVLENEALGYKLKYDLISFEYDFGRRMFFYQGYPFFEDMSPKRRAQARRWERKREDAYYGSMMHFMRSLYRNKLKEDHFEVRKLIKLSDAEKKRVTAIYRELMKGKIATGHFSMRNVLEGYPADTAEYYRKVMEEPDKLNVLVNQVLTGDSIAYAADSVTAGLYFNHHLQVVYPPKKMPKEYGVYYRHPAYAPVGPLTSEITLTVDRPLNVLANGSFYDGVGLLSSGYWGWWEKVGNMLPYDYWPPKKKQ